MLKRDKAWGSLNIEETFELKDGRKFDVCAVSRIHVITDNNYGADADGRRGRQETYIDDGEAEIEFVSLPGSKENIKDSLDESALAEIDAKIEAIEAEKEIEDYSFSAREDYYDKDCDY